MKKDFLESKLLERYNELKKIPIGGLPSNRKKRHKILKKKKSVLYTRFKEYVCETLGNKKYTISDHITISLEDCDIKLADMGTCMYLDDLFSNELQTEYYRAPEIIMGHKFNEKIDIWSVGCVIYELITGNLLFDPKKSKHFSRCKNHLLDIIELFGEFDTNFIKKCKYKTRFFDHNNKFSNMPKMDMISFYDNLKLYVDEDQCSELNEFLKNFFIYNINQRCSAIKALQHNWLQNC